MHRCKSGQNEKNIFFLILITLCFQGKGEIWISVKLPCFCQTPLQLAKPTQFQLVGKGVDFVFPRKKKEGRNPHLASSKRNDPKCLNFSDCLVGNCLEAVWQVSGGCMVAVWSVS